MSKLFLFHIFLGKNRVKVKVGILILALLLSFIYFTWNFRGDPRPRLCLNQLLFIQNGCNDQVPPAHPLRPVPPTASQQVITVITVACRGPPDKVQLVSGTNVPRQLLQAETMIKSLLIQQQLVQEKVELIIFTDSKEYFNEIEILISTFNSEYQSLIQLKYLPVTFPTGFEHLKYIHYPCTMLRLFLDIILPNHEYVVYVDTDVIFLKPVSVLFNDLYSFNQSQWCGMASDAYQAKDMPLPYYSCHGINAGVGLYNLTRLRQLQIPFGDSVKAIFAKYRKLNDQDILNIYFHQNPSELFLLGCGRNFIPSFCLNNRHMCPSVNSGTGITILHGLEKTFMPKSYDKFFLSVFEYFKTLSLMSIHHDILKSDIRNVLHNAISGSNCLRKLDIEKIL